MGNGSKENPYTREDVLRLIEKNGGTTKGLNLSGKVLEREIDLRQRILIAINLKGADLVSAHLEGADLRDANLEEAYLADAHLEKACLVSAHLKKVCLFGAHLEKAILAGAPLEGADLVSTHLEEAYLADAHLEKASLQNAHLEGAYLDGAIFSADTRLENVDWGNYVLGEEKAGDYYSAEETYRCLKMWYTNAGIYDIAGNFFFREMTAKRKSLKWWPNPFNRAFSKLLSILCGYGEKPERVVISALVIIFGLAIAYRFGGLSLPYSIYYSFVSFTALGYGSWVPQPAGWAKAMGAAEAVIGVFMMALFLVTFTRKMTR